MVKFKSIPLFLLVVLVAVASLTLSLNLKASSETTQISDDQTYSWWTRPIAAKVENNSYITGVDNQGNWIVSLTKNGKTQTKKIAEAKEADDHNAPAILANEGKDSLIFFARHHKSRNISFVRAAEGTLNFGPIQNIIFPKNTTYTQVLNDGSDRIILLTRSGICQWRYVVSEDYGKSWSNPKILLDTCKRLENVYLLASKSDANPDQYHLAMTAHPEQSTWRNISYASLNFKTGEITNSNGVLGNIFASNKAILTDDTFEKTNLVDQNDPNNRLRLLDIADKRGKTIILYAEWKNDNLPVYKMAIRNQPGEWTSVDLGISSGKAFGGKAVTYIGGAMFDSNKQNTIFISKEDGGNWSILKYKLDAKLSLTNPSVVASSPDPLVRPLSIAGDKNSLVYQKIEHYSSFTNYKTSLLSQ